jgi:O-acetyl-ADP-ribose deacetylase (regulator of RNase III)
MIAGVSVLERITILEGAISTGVYGYPLREAADTAIATIAAELEAHDRPDKVILCTYDTLATKITTEAFQAFQALQAREAR